MLQGFAISNAIRRLDIAGHEVTQQLRKQLVEAGYELGNAADLEPVRRMKEKLCFLSVPEAPAEVTPTPDAQCLPWCDYRNGSLPPTCCQMGTGSSWIQR